MSVAFATLVFGELPYLKYTEAVNRAYCARHGYKYVTIIPDLTPQRSPIWYKVSGVRDLLRVSDYVAFIDADAYVHDQDRTIEALVSEHMGNAAVLLGTDRRDKDFAWSDENANCGVFVVRRCEKAFAILDEWWQCPIPQRKGLSRWIRLRASQRHRQLWLWRWPSEQGPFNAYIRTGAHRDSIRTVHYAHLNGVDGTFIRHLIGYSDEDRLVELRKVVTRLGSMPAPRARAAAEPAELGNGP